MDKHDGLFPSRIEDMFIMSAINENAGPNAFFIVDDFLRRTYMTHGPFNSWDRTKPLSIVSPATATSINMDLIDAQGNEVPWMTWTFVSRRIRR